MAQLDGRARTEFGQIDPGIADTEIETKLVDLYGIKARVEQIRGKYAAALAEDDLKARRETAGNACPRKLDPHEPDSGERVRVVPLA
ncbi:MAG: hypothetical protein WBC67_17805 [Candidatus Acidiferrales bacterium]